jgi:hypothetical protein
VATVQLLIDRIYRQTNYNDKPGMIDLLNDGLNMLIDAGKLRKKTTISVVANTNSYALPADFKAPGLIQDETDPNGILPYSLVDISENRFGYAIEDGYIYIKPMPTQVVTLTHYYYNYAVPLVEDTDIPEIDSQYHSTIADYAIAMILPLLPNPDKGAIDRAWSRWQSGLAGYTMSATKKNKNSSARMKVIW